jgi:hypothetical protein
MKTDDLIKMLGTNLDPVRPNELRNTMLVALAVAVGIVAAIRLGWAGLHAPTGMDNEAHWDFMAIALAFTLGFAAVGTRMLFMFARPGRYRGGALLLLGSLLSVVIGALIMTLRTPTHTTWNSTMAMGSWGTCLVCIPIFAAIPFGALI